MWTVVFVSENKFCNLCECSMESKKKKKTCNSYKVLNQLFSYAMGIISDSDFNYSFKIW